MSGSRNASRRRACVDTGAGLAIAANASRTSNAALAAEIERAEARLQNPGFTGKAPAALVEQEREKLATNRTMLAALAQRLESLRADA